MVKMLKIYFEDCKRHIQGPRTIPKDLQVNTSLPDWSKSHDLSLYYQATRQDTTNTLTRDLTRRAERLWFKRRFWHSYQWSEGLSIVRAALTIIQNDRTVTRGKSRQKFHFKAAYGGKKIYYIFFHCVRVNVD